MRVAGILTEMSSSTGAVPAIVYAMMIDLYQLNFIREQKIE